MSSRTTTCINMGRPGGQRLTGMIDKINAAPRLKKETDETATATATSLSTSHSFVELLAPFLDRNRPNLLCWHQTKGLLYRQHIDRALAVAHLDASFAYRSLARQADRKSDQIEGQQTSKQQHSGHKRELSVESIQPVICSICCRSQFQGV